MQTLSILIQNIRHQQTVYYLFSNDHINNIAAIKFDFEDDEVLGYYVNLLKTISLRLNEDTVQFFFKDHMAAAGRSPRQATPMDEEKNGNFTLIDTSDNNGGVLPPLSPSAAASSSSSSFPLYTEAIKFVAHRDVMVRAAVKTLTLNVFGIPLPSLRHFLTAHPSAQFFDQIAAYTVERCTALDRLLSSWDAGAAPKMAASVETCLAEIEDLLSYFNDVLAIGVPLINSLMLGHVWTQLVGPVLFWPLLLNNKESTAAAAAGDGEEGGLPTRKGIVGPLCSLYALERVFYAVTDPLLSSLLVSALLGGSTAAAAEALTAAALSSSSANTPYIDHITTTNSNNNINNPMCFTSANDFLKVLHDDSAVYRSQLLGMLRGHDAQLAAAALRVISAILSRRTLPEETVESVGLLPRRRSKQRALLEELTRDASSLSVVHLSSPGIAVVVGGNEDEEVLEVEGGGEMGIEGDAAVVRVTLVVVDDDAVVLSVVVVLQSGIENGLDATTSPAADTHANGALPILNDDNNEEGEEEDDDEEEDAGPATVATEDEEDILERSINKPDGIIHTERQQHQILNHHHHRGGYFPSNETFFSSASIFASGPAAASTQRGDTHFNEIVSSFISTLELDLLPPLSTPVLGWALYRLLSSDAGGAVLTADWAQVLEKVSLRRRSSTAALVQGPWADVLLPMVAAVWKTSREVILRVGAGSVHVAGNTWAQAVLVHELHWQLGGGGGGVGAEADVSASNFSVAGKLITVAVATCVAVEQIYAVLNTGNIPIEPPCIGIVAAAAAAPTTTISISSYSPSTSSPSTAAAAGEIKEGAVIPLPDSANLMPCKVAFQQGVEVNVVACILGFTGENKEEKEHGTTTTTTPAQENEKESLLHLKEKMPTCGSPVVALLDPGTGPTLGYGTVLSVAPLVAANPKRDERHEMWLHVHVRSPSSLLLRLLSTGPAGAELAAMDRQLPEGHWVLAFPDGAAAQQAERVMSDAADAVRRLIKTALQPFLRI